MSISPSSWTERRPRRNVLSEKDFLPHLHAQAAEFLASVEGCLRRTPEEWTQKRLFHLYQAATDVETFLDDFGARENRVYFPFRERVALIRWLSVAMSSLVHLDSRLGIYSLPSLPWVREHLAPTNHHTALAIGDQILCVAKGLQETWEALGGAWPESQLELDSLDLGSPSFLLPRDLADHRLQDSEENAEHHAASFAGRYLRLFETFEATAPFRADNLTELRRLQEKYCREEQCRSFESRLHNLQSDYDSHLSGSKEESEHPALKEVRGTVSVAFHLMEAATALAHIVSRHHLSSFLDSQGRTLLDEAVLLDSILNQGAVQAYEVMAKAVPASKALIEALTETATEVFEIPQDMTMHARPLSQIVSVVNHHQTPVQARMGDSTCNAASMMQLLVMVGSNTKEKAIEFQGDRRTLADLRLLFESRLGEHGLEHYPDELDYLRPA